MTSTWSNIDWLGLIGITAFVFIEKHSPYVHQAYSFLRNKYYHKHQTNWLIPSSFVYECIWWFMIAVQVAGAFIYWQLIPSNSNYYVAVLALFFSHVILCSMWHYTWFYIRKWIIGVGFLVILIGTSAAISVLSGLDANDNNNDVVYTTTALWGFYAVWLGIVLIIYCITYFSIDSLEMLFYCIFEKNMDEAMKYKSTTKVTVRHEESLEHKTGIPRKRRNAHY